MSRKTFSPAEPFATDASLRRVAWMVLAQIVGFFTALRHRQEIRSLGELDDRSLKDIGLTRTDIDGALAQPIHKDPSRLLALRSRERMFRSRALAVMPAE